jgi:hypothetical protein
MEYPEPYNSHSPEDWPRLTAEKARYPVEPIPTPMIDGGPLEHSVSAQRLHPGEATLAAENVRMDRVKRAAVMTLLATLGMFATYVASFFAAWSISLRTQPLAQWPGGWKMYRVIPFETQTDLLRFWMRVDSFVNAEVTRICPLPDEAGTP